MLPKFPINVTFDPSKSEYAKDLWAIPAGRILMLLWRPSHLCGTDWFKEALPIAQRIEKARPKSEDALYKCFWPSISGGADFTGEDCLEFTHEAIDFFTSNRHVPYEGVVSGQACMERE